MFIEQAKLPFDITKLLSEDKFNCIVFAKPQDKKTSLFAKTINQLYFDYGKSSIGITREITMDLDELKDRLLSYGLYKYNKIPDILPGKYYDESLLSKISPSILLSLFHFKSIPGLITNTKALIEKTKTRQPVFIDEADITSIALKEPHQYTQRDLQLKVLLDLHIHVIMATASPMGIVLQEQIPDNIFIKETSPNYKGLDDYKFEPLGSDDLITELDYFYEKRRHKDNVLVLHSTFTAKHETMYEMFRNRGYKNTAFIVVNSKSKNNIIIVDCNGKKYSTSSLKEAEHIAHSECDFVVDIGGLMLGRACSIVDKYGKYPLNNILAMGPEASTGAIAVQKYNRMAGAYDVPYRDMVFRSTEKEWLELKRQSNLINITMEGLVPYNGFSLKEKQQFLEHLKHECKKPVAAKKQTIGWKDNRIKNCNFMLVKKYQNKQDLPKGIYKWTYFVKELAIPNELWHEENNEEKYIKIHNYESVGMVLDLERDGNRKDRHLHTDPSHGKEIFKRTRFITQNAVIERDLDVSSEELLEIEIGQKIATATENYNQFNIWERIETQDINSFIKI